MPSFPDCYVSFGFRRNTGEDLSPSAAVAVAGNDMQQLLRVLWEHPEAIICVAWRVSAEEEVALAWSGRRVNLLRSCKRCWLSWQTRCCGSIPRLSSVLHERWVAITDCSERTASTEHVEKLLCTCMVVCDAYTCVISLLFLRMELQSCCWLTRRACRCWKQQQQSCLSCRGRKPSQVKKREQLLWQPCPKLFSR